jgi:hypothetical protein
MIVCGLRAGHTMKEIKSYGNINKSTMLKENLKNLSLLEDLLIQF